MTRTTHPASATFGPFRLHPTRRQLFEGAAPVRLGGRALELLCALVEAGGAVLSREALVARVWPTTVVEDTSLRVHIAALRKALGDGQGGRRYIVNIVGRGYAFVAPVSWRPEDEAALAPLAGASPSHNLPVRLLRAVGRDEVVATLSERVMERRLVSVVGPGGIGKTTVALAVAEGLIGTFAHGLCFVDLAPVSAPEAVTATLLCALGAGTPAHGSLQALCDALRDRHLLIVLDNCEHLVDALAALAKALIEAADGVHVLATSREPLNVEGEAVHRLAGLASPDPLEPVDAEQALRFAAVQLFVERATASSDAFALSDANLVPVLQLCRRLDGIPLAIELAAGRVGILGVRGLLETLDRPPGLVGRGKRSAPSRHRTLGAMLDWSYLLLTEDEQRVLCALAVFRRAFSLRSACAVAAGDGLSAGPAGECLMDLVDKSLVASDASGDAVRYRLLETTKAYAAERLMAGGREHAVRSRHAAHMRDRYTRAEADWDAMSRGEWLALYGDGLDDVRAALDWSFGLHGDASIGVALTTAAVLPLYEAGLLLLDEYHQHVERALGRLPSLDRPEPMLEMRLNAALCLRSWDERRQAQVRSAVAERTLVLAELCVDAKSRIAALYAVWVSAFTAGDYRRATTTADDLSVRARDADDRAAMLLGDRLLAITRHVMGDHAAGWSLAERVLQHDPIRMPAAYSSPVPREVLMKVVLARILWLRGCADRAASVAGEAVDLATAAHPIAQSQALAIGAIPIALWRGDHGAARAMTEQLARSAARHTSHYWRSYAESYGAVLSVRESKPAADEVADAPILAIRGSNPMELDHVATVTTSWISDECLTRVERGDVAWCAPEILRARGEQERRRRTPEGNAAAEVWFSRSLRMARDQGALSWELRATMSVARLRRDQGRGEKAAEALKTCCGRFSEGLGTADLRTALALLARLSEGV
jgi:predicted ATPase/DNA-binding winged helix-turn-helix (wHTH) protein